VPRRSYQPSFNSPSRRRISFISQTETVPSGCPRRGSRHRRLKIGKKEGLVHWAGRARAKSRPPGNAGPRLQALPVRLGVCGRVKAPGANASVRTLFEVLASSRYQRQSVPPSSWRPGVNATSRPAASSAKHAAFSGPQFLTQGPKIRPARERHCLQESVRQSIFGLAPRNQNERGVGCPLQRRRHPS